MFVPDNILNELKELSPSLAAIPKVNVYSVPSGYFDHVSGQLLLLAHTSDLLLKESTFTVPNNYFDTLADSILDRIKKESEAIEATETRKISNLVAGIGNNNVYSVPPGYFNKVEEQIVSLVSKEPEMASYSSSNKSGELLAVIGNKNVYRIPPGYFENVAEEAKQKITRPAKVISLYQKISFLKYAAAAVITGILGLSILFVFNKKNEAIGPSAQTSAAMTEAMQIIKANNFDKEMEAISDASIVAFLEDKGQDVEAALVASLADEKELPDADDYLFNENALNDVLNRLDLNN